MRAVPARVAHGHLEVLYSDLWHFVYEVLLHVLLVAIARTLARGSGLGLLRLQLRQCLLPRDVLLDRLSDRKLRRSLANLWTPRASSVRGQLCL